MLRDLLKLALLSPTGMETVGIPLQLKGDFVSIHCKVGCLLSDGDGLRLALQWMGSASLHPCFRHWNVLKKGSARAEHCDRYVEIDCHCDSRMQTWSNVELTEAIDVCVDADQQHALGHLTNKRLQETPKHVWVIVPPNMAFFLIPSSGATSTSCEFCGMIGRTPSWQMVLWVPTCGS